MTTFHELGLSAELTRALDELNFTTPTPIQAITIPYILEKPTDLIALAQTGTGKTAAFSLPILEQINADSKAVQAIILCPTRELCRQIAKDISNFVKYLNGISSTAVYGGEDIRKQITNLKRNPQIIIGTPGRVHDMIRRNILKLDQLKWLVLDEADEMLSMGFKDELDAILAETPKEKQTLLFSATMPRAISYIAQKYMNNPEEVSTGKGNSGAENVEHHFYVAHAKDRYETLRRICDANPSIYGIIFCRTRNETKEVADKLIRDKYSAEAIHGDLSQSQREDAMARFRRRDLQLLVATDVASHGIDVDVLTHVINYNLPENVESYIHRSGRTGRAGCSGVSLTIINMREQRQIHQIESRLKKPFIQKMIPTGSEICQRQLLELIDKVQQVTVNKEQIAQHLAMATEKFKDFSREDLISHFISMEFNRFLEFYKNARDLNQGASNSNASGRDGQSSRNERSQGRHQFTTLSINIGRKNHFSPKDLLNFINEQPALKHVEVGSIEIKNEATVFEIDQVFEQKVMDAFKGLETDAGLVQVRKIQGAPSSNGGGGRGRVFSRGPNRNRGGGGRSQDRSRSRR